MASAMIQPGLLLPARSHTASGLVAASMSTTSVKTKTRNPGM
jgi:hypothetical protein